MKAVQVNQTNVIAKAVQFVNNFNMDINDAVRKGIMLEQLKSRMLNGELVKFKYMKVDGTIRSAIGTLQVDVVAANTKANVPRTTFKKVLPLILVSNSSILVFLFLFFLISFLLNSLPILDNLQTNYIKNNIYCKVHKLLSNFISLHTK